MSNNKTMNDSDVSGIILSSPFNSGLREFGELRLDLSEFDPNDDNWDEETIPMTRTEKEWFI